MKCWEGKIPVFHIHAVLSTGRCIQGPADWTTRKSVTDDVTCLSMEHKKICCRCVQEHTSCILSSKPEEGWKTFREENKFRLYSLSVLNGYLQYGKSSCRGYHVMRYSTYVLLEVVNRKEDVASAYGYSLDNKLDCLQVLRVGVIRVINRKWVVGWTLYTIGVSGLEGGWRATEGGRIWYWLKWCEIT